MKQEILMKRILMLAGVATAMVFCVKAQAMNPASIPGCVLWLDAAELTATTGEAVASWNDKSGGTHSMFAPVPASAPTISTNLLNGRKTLNFSGTQWLQGNAVLSSGGGKFSYFIVWRRNGDQGSGHQTVIEQFGDAAYSRAALLARSGVAYGLCTESNDSYPNTYAAGSWKNTCLEYDASPVRDIQVADGSTVTVTNQNVLVWDETMVRSGWINDKLKNTGTTRGFSIGRTAKSTGENLNGDIAEIIVFDCVLDSTTRNNLQVYLQNKWGFASKLKACSLIIDFEHWETMPADWTLDGEAFSLNQPFTYPNGNVSLPPQGMRYLHSGLGWSNAYSNNPAVYSSDAPQGTAVSPEILLTNNTIRLSVGGGVATQERISLECKNRDGTWDTVRYTTGPRGSAISEVRWNVANLMGETVRIVAADLSSGSWGIITVDNIRFLDEPYPMTVNATFNDGTYPDTLYLATPLADQNTLTKFANGKLRHAFYAFYSWPFLYSTTDDRAPKLLVPLRPTARDFVLETYVSSLVSDSATTVSSGLTLILDAYGVGSFNPITFAVRTSDNSIRLEAPLQGNASYAAGTIFTLANGTNTLRNGGVYLRIKRTGNAISYCHSFDSMAWTLDYVGWMLGSNVQYAGLYSKTDANYNATAEFDYLKFNASDTESAPFGIAGCALWLDAADRSTLVTNGLGFVEQWLDKSGVGNHLFQTNAVKRPVVSAMPLNGHYPVWFDGVDDYFDGAPVLGQSSPEHNYFVVYQKRTLGNAACLIDQYLPAGGNRNRAAFFIHSSNQLTYQAWSGDAYFLTTPLYVANTWKVSAIEFNKVCDKDGVYLDDESGEYVKTPGNNFVATSCNVAGNGGFRIGARGHALNGAAGDYWNGEIAEVLVFNRALNSAERYAILSYLQNKWNVGTRYSPADEASVRQNKLCVAPGKAINLRGKTESYSSVEIDNATVTNGVLIADTVTVRGVSRIPNVQCQQFTKTGDGTATVVGSLDAPKVDLQGGSIVLRAPGTLDASAVLYLPFDSPGKVTNDYSSAAVQLEVEPGSTPPVWTRKGRFGGGLFLDGTSSLRSLGGLFPSSIPTGAAPYTVSAFVQMAAGGEETGWIGYGIPSAARSANNFCFRETGRFKVRNYWYSADKDVLLNSGNTFMDKWSSIVGTWDGTTRTIYLDGFFVGSWTDQTPDVKSADGMVVVGRALNNAKLKGWLDDVTVYNRALVPDEVKQLALSGAKPTSYIDTVAVAEGSTLDLGKGNYTVEHVEGRGAITNGNLTVTKSITPNGLTLSNLTIADGVVIDRGGRSPIQVAGALTLLGGGTTDLSGVEKDTFNWFTYGTLVGDFSKWFFTGVKPASAAKLVVGGGSVKLSVQPKGLLVLVY